MSSIFLAFCLIELFDDFFLPLSSVALLWSHIFHTILVNTYSDEETLILLELQKERKKNLHNNRSIEIVREVSG